MTFLILDYRLAISYDKLKAVRALPEDQRSKLLGSRLVNQALARLRRD